MKPRTHRSAPASAIALCVAMLRVPGMEFNSRCEWRGSQEPRSKGYRHLSDQENMITIV